ncbi:hypothetical protein FOL46_003030, partial [Perkinsus olseni]
MLRPEKRSRLSYQAQFRYLLPQMQRLMASQLLVNDEVADVRSPDSQDSGVQRDEMLAPEIPEVPEMEEATDEEPPS